MANLKDATCIQQYHSFPWVPCDQHLRGVVRKEIHEGKVE